MRKALSRNSRTICGGLFLLALFVLPHTVAHAATLRVSPDTGIYTVGGTFSASVLVNTQGRSVNAADGQLSFNPRELAVVSVSRTSSIFNLWTQEPSFSNSAGTITFGGGSPTGYTGTGGAVISITFRPLAAGTPKITFTSGSILAADGMGTNVLTSMNGASYTIAAKSEEPLPEYIAPANTPAAPVVTSSTHGDPRAWYKETTAQLSWKVPEDVTAVRTLLDDSETTVPTIVYDEPIRSREIPDLSQGVSYFHIQFKNVSGWGRITHYRLAVDTEPPSLFSIGIDESENPSNPAKTLLFTVEDNSPIVKYLIQIDGGEPIEYNDTEHTGRYTLAVLPPGHHTVSVEAFDSAGNSKVASHSFDIASFEAPTFTEFPTRLTPGIIPAITGVTRPDALLTVTLARVGGEEESYELTARGDGTFTFIPDEPLPIGVFDITAVAKDTFGAMSERSSAIRIIVEEPGLIRLGTLVVSVLSVLVPLLALLVISIFGTWFLWHRLAAWRKRIARETIEAEQTLKTELDEVITNLHIKVGELRDTRKGKLTRAEQNLIDQIELDLGDARAKLKKEISDIEHIVQ